MNKISVIGLDKKFKKFEEEIRGVALKILGILNKTDVLAEIYLIDGRKMRFLNKKFLGKDKTTTVLSFEEPKNFIYPPERGQTRTGRKQSRKIKRIGEIYLNMKLTTNYKLQTTNYLLIHGLLHLFGYEHQKKNNRIKMEYLENLVIRKLEINI
ncbi:MAG: rRNA maturation RNase YbeY [Patescibacteria group bacterium]